MPESSTPPPLHLPNLHIEGFRGIRSLRIKRLGRATLLAGKNGVGKTTVLEAVRAFAARGREIALLQLLRGRNEVVKTDSSEGERRSSPDFAALFHGRNLQGAQFTLGPSETSEQVRIHEGVLPENYAHLVDALLPDDVANDSVRVLKMRFRDESRILPVFSVTDDSFARSIAIGSIEGRRFMRHAAGNGDWPAAIKCLALGPGPLPDDEIARLWDTIALTDQEDEAVMALRLVTGERVERVAPVGTGRHPRQQVMRVKIGGLRRPIPLQSLGDGAVRLFAVAVALANSKDGFLTIDEVENGIHHTVQKAFWRMVLMTAQANNVQVFATTHSSDCVRGFVQAADESDGIDIALVRVDRRNEHTVAVEYSRKGATTAAEQGIEVR